MPILETLMWNNEAAERSSVFEVRSGEAIVQRVWVEYDVVINVQMYHSKWSKRGMIENAVVRLNNEAAVADFELMSVD